MEAVEWLDDVEARAWRALVVASTRLKAVLDAELMAAHGLSFGDYEVLVVLSETPARRLRMSELAELLALSPSGLTRRLDRLTRDGLVEREQCPFDKRGSYAVLTGDGLARLEAAAPLHVEGVRRHFVDLLDRRQLDVLGPRSKRWPRSAPGVGSVRPRRAARDAWRRWPISGFHTIVQTVGFRLR